MSKNAVALRRFSHAGTTYQKDAPMPLSAAQFNDWEKAGLVTAAKPTARAPVASKAKAPSSKAKAAPPKQD